MEPDRSTASATAASRAGVSRPATGSFATTHGAHTGIGTLPIVFFGTEFDAFEMIAGWTYDSRNRALFADRGARQRLAGDEEQPS